MSVVVVYFVWFHWLWCRCTCYCYSWFLSLTKNYLCCLCRLYFFDSIRMHFGLNSLKSHFCCCGLLLLLLLMLMLLLFMIQNHCSLASSPKWTGIKCVFISLVSQNILSRCVVMGFEPISFRLQLGIIKSVSPSHCCCCLSYCIFWYHFFSCTHTEKKTVFQNTFSNRNVLFSAFRTKHQI